MNEIDTYAKSDHARTHKALIPGPERDTSAIRSDYEHLMREGYVIIENVLGRHALDDIRSAAARFLSKTGRNSFEGMQTQRVYNVLGKTRSTDALAEHPRVLGILDRLFLPNYLLSQSQIINIHPGETAQTLHYDDAFYRFPRPRPPLGAATIWAIDDFTDKNGATVIVPRSQEWGDDQYPKRSTTISAIMPAGSVVIFLGTTWHGGGQNRTDAPRLAVTHQYCEPFLRQQENYLLELQKETVKALTPQMRQLVGYSVHPPFMGMVDGQHPLRLLED